MVKAALDNSKVRTHMTISSSNSWVEPILPTNRSVRLLKCFFGAMNPGQSAPHRACAIRCISGGIPPVLLVRLPNGTATYFLLVSANGKPVNRQVLDFVAEPVQITGEVERQGGLLILRADPADYHRL